MNTQIEQRAGKCNICNDVFTPSHVEVEAGRMIFVCAECVEIAKDNFIWFCLTCGKSFIRPKELVINRIKDHELKKAYMLCRDMYVIQGIDRCLACHPERMVQYMETLQTMEC